MGKITALNGTLWYLLFILQRKPEILRFEVVTLTTLSNGMLLRWESWFSLRTVKSHNSSNSLAVNQMQQRHH